MTPEEILLLLSERVRNIGPTEVGRRAGMTCGNVHKMVNSGSNPSLFSVYKICKAVGLRINIQDAGSDSAIDSAIDIVVKGMLLKSEERPAQPEKDEKK